MDDLTFDQRGARPIAGSDATVAPPALAGDDPLRILMVIPFSPRFDSAHGGRVTAQLLRSLVPDHRVALVHRAGRCAET